MTTLISNNPWINLSTLDKALVIVALAFSALALVNPEQASASLEFTLDALFRLSPALILALGLGAWVSVSGAEGLIARVFAGRPVVTIVAAALFGALSPFCSCTVVPLVMLLLSAGVPLAPVMAFWLSSPLMDPQTFFIVGGVLGFSFALVKLTSAVGIALLGGFSTHVIDRLWTLENPLRADRRVSDCEAQQRLTDQKPRWKFWQWPELRKDFFNKISTNGLFLVKIMSIAFLLESLMLTWIPAEKVAILLGDDSPWAIPLAALVGVPAYLNSLVAIPLTAGLIDMGMSQGAALAFLTAGAISSIPAAFAVFAIAKRMIFALYLVLALVGSIASGYIYQIFLQFF